MVAARAARPTANRLCNLRESPIMIGLNCRPMPSIPKCRGGYGGGTQRERLSATSGPAARRAVVRTAAGRRARPPWAGGMAGQCASGVKSVSRIHSATLRRRKRRRVMLSRPFTSYLPIATGDPARPSERTREARGGSKPRMNTGSRGPHPDSDAGLCGCAEEDIISP